MQTGFLSLENLFKGEIEKTPVIGGQVAGRIHDIPTAKELLDRIVRVADETPVKLREWM
ncbi:MAG: hypothetical protein JXL84_19865 [Deltaproteobacteria bacterium]|nr:hypothetical protein [Deltaproteobacteria bacterium]